MIEGNLMTGMGVVSDLFGTEKCFTTGSKICEVMKKQLLIFNSFHEAEKILLKKPTEKY